MSATLASRLRSGLCESIIELAPAAPDRRLSLDAPGAPWLHISVPRGKNSAYQLFRDRIGDPAHGYHERRLAQAHRGCRHGRPPLLGPAEALPL